MRRTNAGNSDDDPGVSVDANAGRAGHSHAIALLLGFGQRIQSDQLRRICHMGNSVFSAICTRFLFTENLRFSKLFV